MRALLGVLILSGASVFLAASPQAPPPAADLAKLLQAHYGTVRDFTADFTHTYRGALRQSLSERGTVRIKKPGRMYWTYTSPEKKEFVSDGSKIFSYLQADNILYVTDMPAGDQAPTAVMFLTGRGDLTRDFTAALPATQPDSAWQLDLTPKVAQADFTALSIRVDRRSFAILGLTSTDQLGGTSTFAFTSLRENVGLTDNQFAFKIPPHAEIRR